MLSVLSAQPVKQVPLVKRAQPEPRVSLVLQALQVKRAPLALRAQPGPLAWPDQRVQPVNPDLQELLAKLASQALPELRAPWVLLVPQVTPAPPELLAQQV